MFADDTNINFAANTFSDLKNVINSEQNNLIRWLKANKLSLNVAKTEFMTIGSRQRLHTHVNDNINIEIDGKLIDWVDEAKSLGLLIDKHLSWTWHVDETTKKILSAIDALKRVRSFISTSTAIQIYQALIRPHFDYCSSVWDGLNVTLGDKLQKLQNRAPRVIARLNYETSANFLLDGLRWDNLATQQKKLKAILLFKILINVV